ncbi:hypothetical protein [Sinisalibacter aestuarii]|uniref:Uncharacterized protein n=1 Tax=Sinisalibacter aestuarii TaxID=2949426 RepID=A0ABQ5LQ68_9RHOB|nr:hypothetical protein [Sinisalibacter aestuarii]GKY87147.1 hypothetical protein STA1M1_10160 [Sinisalibacter aestuarii]
MSRTAAHGAGPYLTLAARGAGGTDPVLRTLSGAVHLVIFAAILVNHRVRAGGLC